MGGSGYPVGISDSDITVEARIIAVADAVETMASYRPYRPALGIEYTLAEIHEGAGIQYDPDIDDICLSLFDGGLSRNDIPVFALLLACCR